MRASFDSAGINSLLRELSDELERRGAQADVFLVGGAAMALAYDARRATRDLDAVFAPMCGFTTVEEGLELLQRSYPAALIQPKTQYLLAEIIESMNAEPSNEA